MAYVSKSELYLSFIFFIYSPTFAHTDCIDANEVQEVKCQYK